MIKLLRKLKVVLLKDKKFTLTTRANNSDYIEQYALDDFYSPFADVQLISVDVKELSWREYDRLNKPVYDRNNRKIRNTAE